MYNNYYDSEFINSYNNDISNLPSFYNNSINGAPFDNDRFFNLNNEAEMFTYENNGHLYFIEDNILNKNEDNDKYKVKLNKFSKDNLIRKIKSKLMTAILSYINSLLEKYYLQNEIKSVVFLQKVDQKYIKDTSINFNIKLFNLKIKDIFSDGISLKYKALGRNFNKNLINKMCQGKSQKNIISTLEMTFLECLEHVSGKKHYESLKGLEKEFQLIVNNMNETDKYIEAFNNLLNKFEFHFKNATPKKKLGNKNFYLK